MHNLWTMQVANHTHHFFFLHNFPPAADHSTSALILLLFCPYFDDIAPCLALHASLPISKLLLGGHNLLLFGASYE